MAVNPMIYSLQTRLSIVSIFYFSDDLLLYSAASFWGIVRTVNVSEVPTSKGGGVRGWGKRKGLTKMANMVAVWEDNL